MYQNKKINQDEFTKRLSLLSKNQLDELITVAQRKGISQADIQAGLKSIQQLLAKEKKNDGHDNYYSVFCATDCGILLMRWLHYEAVAADG